jgi:penicillin-binding protein 2
MATIHETFQRRLSRRVMLMGGLQAAAFTGIIGRLAHLQFVHNEAYRMQSEENRVQLKVVAPVRAEVLDRAGKALAENQINYRLFIEREALEPTLQTLKRMMRLVELTPEQQAALHEKVRASRRHRPVLLKERLSWEEVVKVEFHLAELPSITLEEGHMRHYPLMGTAAHLVGYVGRVSSDEAEKLTALHRLPEFKVGKNGVEQANEQTLRGKAGSRELEVNARGIVVRELSYNPYEAGDAVKLTIDAELQRFAAECLGDESGSVVVMDTQRGDLLCCASMPAFDPNVFSRGIGTEYWSSLRENERNPLLNKAITGMYPPASTFKMLVALAGLEAGIIKNKTSFFCPGHYRLGNRTFNCWKPGGHGWVGLTHALAESCDTYFYNIGEQIGIDAITDMARRFGLGEVSQLGLIGEKGGLLPSDAWKRRVHTTPWVKGDTINASIGQGFLLATPMQLATMTARMVSGKAISPRLYADAPMVEPEMLRVDVSHLKRVMDGMYAVCNERFGTAYWKRIAEEGMEMGGKTGTAQVRRILKRGQDQSKLPWRHRHHGLFVGYAPVHNPQFVCSVVIEHGGGGSSAAAPIARDVLKKVQELVA